MDRDGLAWLGWTAQDWPRTSSPVLYWLGKAGTEWFGAVSQGKSSPRRQRMARRALAGQINAGDESRVWARPGLACQGRQREARPRLYWAGRGRQKEARFGRTRHGFASQAGLGRLDVAGLGMSSPGLSPRARLGVARGEEA